MLRLFLWMMLSNRWLVSVDSICAVAAALVTLYGVKVLVVVRLLVR